MRDGRWEGRREGSRKERKVWEGGRERRGDNRLVPELLVKAGAQAFLFSQKLLHIESE